MGASGSAHKSRRGAPHVTYPASTNLNEIHVVGLGYGGVGKTCFILQFVTGKFIEEYDPTIEDTYRKQITVDDETVVFDILDTAGEEEYSAMRDQWIRYGQAFFFIFSLTSRKSYEYIRELMEQMMRVKDVNQVSEVVCVLVGNKLDLEAERQVPAMEAADFANSHGITYFETSARTNVNVEQVFSEICRQVRTRVRSAAMAAGPKPVMHRKD